MTFLLRDSQSAKQADLIAATGVASLESFIRSAWLNSRTDFPRSAESATRASLALRRVDRDDPVRLARPRASTFQGVLP
jgi:hypothetical protein